MADLAASNRPKRREIPTLWVCLLALAMTWGASSARAQTAQLPDAPGLAEVRGELQTLVAGLHREGLPSKPLVAKVREGLAKGVEPQRILTAAYAVAYDTRIIARLVELHLPDRAADRANGANRAKALAVGMSGRAAGLTVSGIDAMFRQVPRVGVAVAIAAVDTAADLAAAGYPTRRSTELVVGVLARPRPGQALPVVLAELEATRLATGVSRIVAVDAIADLVENGHGLAVAARLSRLRPAGNEN